MDHINEFSNMSVETATAMRECVSFCLSLLLSPSPHSTVSLPSRPRLTSLFSLSARVWVSTRDGAEAED